MSMDQSAVGFIGVGNMGRPMAANLLRAGYPVWVYDRDAGKTGPLVAAGAYQAATLAEAVEHAEVVVTMVRDDSQLTAATLDLGGILELLRPGAVHVSTCTVSPETLRDLAAAYQQQGRAFVAATVLGRPEFAATGQLTIMVAGPSEAKRRVLPLLEVLGNVTDYGEQPEQAAYVKLQCNYLLAAGQAVMGEARALALGCGIDPERLLGMLASSRSFLEGLAGYAARIARDDHDDVRFPVPMGQKDLRLVAETADRVGVPMPIARIVLAWLAEAARLGWADQDWSALARVPAAEAGLLLEPAT